MCNKKRSSRWKKDPQDIVIWEKIACTFVNRGIL